jgi:IclR helix-turn-helix domain
VVTLTRCIGGRLEGAKMLMAEPEGETTISPLQARDPVAQRILLVLEACAALKRPLTMMELVNATGLAKTTVHRMCWKLVDLGLLERSEEGFAIGTKVFALANANPVINEIRVAAMPYLLELQGPDYRWAVYPRSPVDTACRCWLATALHSRWESHRVKARHPEA